MLCKCVCVCVYRALLQWYSYINMKPIKTKKNLQQNRNAQLCSKRHINGTLHTFYTMLEVKNNDNNTDGRNKMALHIALST